MSYTLSEQKTVDFLKKLIAIPSTRGNEGPAALLAQAAFNDLGVTTSLIPITDELMQDPDYAFPLPDFKYVNSYNVECLIEGQDTSRNIVFNTHLDVVPPSEGQERAYQADIHDGVLFGRGACDAKGMIAVLHALASYYRDRGIRPPCNLVFHLVVEEENGGNGTLAMVRRGVNADAVVVLESSELSIYAAVRGAVWFTVEVYGKATHSGNVTSRVSAIEKAYQVIEIFQHYHDRLLASSRGLELFDVYDDPMPLTIGQIEAGVWPASVPNLAILKGLLGFLPNMTREQVQAGLRASIETEGDDWLKENYKLEFNMLNNNGNSLATDHPLVLSLSKSLKGLGIQPQIKAMVAACDAWQYSALGIPTIVFGPGSIMHAHSKEEQIRIDDIFLAAKVLAGLVENYIEFAPEHDKEKE